MTDKKIAVELTPSLDDIGKCEGVVQQLLSQDMQFDLIFVKLPSSEFPRRFLDLPAGLSLLLHVNPRVKAIWDDSLDVSCEYDMVQVPSLDDDVLEMIQQSMRTRHQFIDMTMISVFYDSGINPLRKEATKKAIDCWMMQKHIPSEMMFVELGFNGVFTFSREDFPERIDYIRIDGNDSHKYLFQKEHLWNMAAKQAKYEKLMFVDSDIAPMGDVDWFKQVHDQLDRCLFTQGYYTVTYLDCNDNQTKKVKKSFTQNGVNQYEDGMLGTYAPGGVFCIGKTTLQSIDYFNYLPFGGGDLLFWSELSNVDDKQLWFTSLVKRNHVKTIINQIAEASKKVLVDTVYVDVCHFFHGDFLDRSYFQRDYVLATQYPWMDRIICEDEHGLISWIDTNHYFYDVAKNFCHVKDDGKKANDLLKGHFDYVGFYNSLYKFIYQTKSIFTKSQLIRQIQKNIEIYGNQSSVKNARLFADDETSDTPITVITPFYNAQEYIDTYFNSLSKQTIFKKLEIICVDDCSTDSTYPRLLEYSGKYRNVILLRNDVNCGSGHSRNRGLDIATGQYISFLDADDWYYQDDSLERFYNDAKEHCAILCGSAISNVLPNGGLKTFFTKENDIKFNNNFIQFDDYQNIYYFTRYLYSRKFLNDHGIRFRNFKRFQDPYFLYDVMVRVGQFYAVPYSTYCYTTNDHWCSLTATQHYDRAFAIHDLLSILPEKYGKIKQFLLTSVISLFRWDDRLLPMVLEDDQLFLQYYSMLFDDKIQDELQKLPDTLKKVCEEVKGKLNVRSKVSLIIPVYNGARYIDRCLKSILSQTYPNIEIICVDDCSTDSSYEILKEYEGRNQNVRVFKTETNSGCCSNPRNLGMKYATGQYVQFVDIDDMLIDGTVISTLVQTCNKNELDCLRFRFKVLNEQQDSNKAAKMMKYYKLKGDVCSYTNKVMSGTEMYFMLKMNNSYQESAALGMFDIDVLRRNNIQFIENIIHEDVLFTPLVLSNCNRCMQLDMQLYMRSIHSGSIITTTNKNIKKKSFGAIAEYMNNKPNLDNAIMNNLKEFIHNSMMRDDL